MAQDFDETKNPVDAWYADLKGRLRAALRRKKKDWHDIAHETGMSQRTVLSVMYDNNVRHTTSTLYRFAAAVDVRFTLVKGFAKPRRQPDELPKLSKKESSVVNAFLKEIAAERRKSPRRRRRC